MKELENRENRDLAFAVWLASDAHLKQYSADGEAYIMHCLRVMVKMPTTISKTVAVLHDVVEDTDVTLDELRDLKFKECVVSAIDALTHRQGEHYQAYIQRVKLNSLATQVKLADLEDNINALRLPSFGKYEERRVGKYWRAYKELSNGLG